MRCPSCFAMNWDQFRCLDCGFQPMERRDGVYLPIGTALRDGEYLIGKVLGRPGGFGITYLAWDTRLDLKVAIKEYLPLQIAARANDGKTVTIHTVEYDEGFNFGLEKFLDEAKVLAHFRHSNIVRVMNFFKENGTAYMVMDYLEGQSLAEYLGKVGRITGPDAVALFAPVLDGVAHIHARDFIHRDIKPSNIYLTHDGQLILLDFGSARQALREKSQSMTAILSPGFAPWEQYHRKGKQGPWTDVYACAATLYVMVTGQAPSDGSERAIEDDLEPVESFVPNIDHTLADAIKRGLAINPEMRPQTAGEFQALLLGERVNERKQTQPRNQIPAAPTPPNEGAKAGASSAASESRSNFRSLVAARPREAHSSFGLTAPLNGYLESVLPNGSVVQSGSIVFVMSQGENGKRGGGETVAVTVDCDGTIEVMERQAGDFVGKGSRIALLRPAKTDSVSSDAPIQGQSGTAGPQSTKTQKWWAVSAALIVAVGLSLYLNGTITWSSSDGTYSGQAKWGKRHGMGTLVSPDGARYTSNWVDGFAEGPGELILPDGRKFTGTFDMAKNQATIQLSDGSRYEGGFERNNFNGAGKLKRPNGAEYDGYFKDSKKEGRGILRMPDGTKYEGEFRNDNYHGDGTIFRPDGVIIKGAYKEGNLDGIVKKYPNELDAIYVSEYQNGRLVSEKRIPSIEINSIMVKSSDGKNQPFLGRTLQGVQLICEIKNQHIKTINLELDLFYIRPYNKNYSEKHTAYGDSGSSYQQTWKFEKPGQFVIGRHEIQVYWKDTFLAKTVFYIE